MNFPDFVGASSEAVASWFYAQSGDGFAISRAGVILTVNQAWCDILGVNPEQAVGQTAADILPAGALAAYAEGEARLRLRGEEDFELRLDTPRGEVWVTGSIRRGADGYALIVARDVTGERRLAVEREAAANIRSLLWARAGVLTWTFSPADGRFEVDATRDAATDTYSPAARQLTLDEMVQRMHESQREAFVATLLASVESGRPEDFAFRYTDDAGRDRRFSACWQGLSREEDGRWRLAGLTRDLTELMEARDAALAGERLAQEAERVKSRFLANMSHEFRTPLNGVLGVLHLLKQEPMSAEARILLNEAVTSGRVLTSLLNDLLDLSDLDAGRMPLWYEEIDPADVLDELLDQVRPDAQAKGLSVEAPSPSPLPRIAADRAKLRQILAGLLGNAVKFTERGGVVVRLLVVGEGAGRRIRFEIEDTGIGVAPETMTGLFETFSQLDDGATRRFGGVGAGLALSRGLARLMGGDIGGASTPGRGSTFWLELPVRPPSADDLDVATEAPLEGVAVLVVDDNATNRLVATKIVEQLGAAVDTANDGAQAVKAVVEADFDVVLMDIQMPVMDGVEATRTIRELPAPVSQIPIVAMTANVAAEQVAGYEAAGMNGVVAKPISPAALLTEITRLTVATGEAGLYRLIYHSRVSKAVMPRLEQALADILSLSERANRAANVTGALLVCGGWFLQTLEGPRDAVDRTFARIAHDDRHGFVTLVSAGEVPRRRFAAWNMTGHAVSPTEAAIAGFLTNEAAFDPRTQTDEACIALLSAVSGRRAPGAG